MSYNNQLSVGKYTIQEGQQFEITVKIWRIISNLNVNEISNSV